jgi:hypothetical protein
MKPLTWLTVAAVVAFVIWQLRQTAKRALGGPSAMMRPPSAFPTVSSIPDTSDPSAFTGGTFPGTTSPPAPGFTFTLAGDAPLPPGAQA